MSTWQGDDAAITKFRLSSTKRFWLIGPTKLTPNQMHQI
jgi:hypothetical protein